MSRYRERTWRSFVNRFVDNGMAARKKEETGTSKQRYQANARERDRTHSIINKTRDVESSLCSVNTAFTALRTLIPTEPADRKLSKIETLRLASSYINHLGAVLVAGPVDQPCLRLRLRLSLNDEDDGDDGCTYEPNRWTDSQRRPQVCTFCLAMHKKFDMNVSKEMISNY